MFIQLDGLRLYPRDKEKHGGIASPALFKYTKPSRPNGRRKGLMFPLNTVEFYMDRIVFSIFKYKNPERLLKQLPQAESVPFLTVFRRLP
jgi:hypothetical protein